MKAGEAAAACDTAHVPLHQIVDEVRLFVHRHPRLHARARVTKRKLRHAVERVGIERYSRPAYDDLERKLAAYLPERNGIFVEVGAYDGYSGSNTYWFERLRGWSGVLIEPLPELAETARAERPRSQVFQCALVSPEYEDAFVSLLYGGTMSVLVGTWRGDEVDHARVGAEMEGRQSYTIDVPARTFTAVLEEASITDVDLISLDVEGLESQVLRGLDLQRYAPRFLLIEMLRETQERPIIEEILGAEYQHVAKLSIRDHLYRRLQ